MREAFLPILQVRQGQHQPCARGAGSGRRLALLLGLLMTGWASVGGAAGPLPAADEAVLAGAYPGKAACVLTDLRLAPEAAQRAQLKFAATLGHCATIAEPVAPRAGSAPRSADAGPVRRVDIDPPARPAPAVQDPAPQRPMLMPPVRPDTAPAERVAPRLAPRVEAPTALDGAVIARTAVSTAGTETQGLPAGLSSDAQPRLADRAVLARMRQSDDLLVAAARRNDIDPLLLHAVSFVESRHRSDAVSPAGARGIMQLMPQTASRFGVQSEQHLHDQMLNIAAGAAYLKVLQAEFGGDLRLVLAAYNAGEGAVRRHGGRVPPYPETIAYVRDVLAFYQALSAARAERPSGSSQ